MQLNLKNPLLFFDLETTGLDVAKDRIVEISVLKVMPNGTRECRTRRINPEMHISEESTSIHGITDADVAHEPTFKQVAKGLAAFMNGCDIAGFNSTRFDIPLLAEEFLRAGVDFDFRKRKLIDVQNIFHAMEQRTLKAAYKFYCNKELEEAHSAKADTTATFEVLEAQLDRYEGTLKNDIGFLAEFSAKLRRDHPLDYAGRIALNEKQQPVFNFGKHRGKLVEEVLRAEPSYYAWMMNGDFSLDTKKVLTDIKLKMK